MTPHLRVQRLSLSFPTASGPLRVLDDISFELARGERVALLGASGSGKSTLLRVLGGLQRIEGLGQGSVHVDSTMFQDYSGFGLGARARRRAIGFVFQQFQLAPRLELLTNVLIGTLARQPLWRRLSMQFAPHERARALEALKRVGLECQAEQRASTLSGGQQQRGALARVLVQGCDLVLADEPIASLDPETAREVLELLTSLCSVDGSTLLASLHQVDFARRHFPRTIALRAGRMVYDGPTAGLDERALLELYRRDVASLGAAG